MASLCPDLRFNQPSLYSLSCEKALHPNFSLPLLPVPCKVPTSVNSTPCLLRPCISVAKCCLKKTHSCVDRFHVNIMVIDFKWALYVARTSYHTRFPIHIPTLRNNYLTAFSSFSDPHARRDPTLRSQMVSWPHFIDKAGALWRNVPVSVGG